MKQYFVVWLFVPAAAAADFATVKQVVLALNG